MHIGWTNILRIGRRGPLALVVAAGVVIGAAGSMLASAQDKDAAPQPVGDLAALPPPSYNRWIRPDTGRFEAYVWDDRELAEHVKAAEPWYDPRWRPFSSCMASEGFDVRRDQTRPFSQQDLDEIVVRANAQMPNPQENLRIGAQTAAVPGVAGAFLRCADRWLALSGPAWAAHGITPTLPGQVPAP